MVAVFKTDVADERSATFIIHQLGITLPDCRVNFDLDDCDRILRAEGQSINMDAIIYITALLGFYCEELQ